MGILQAGVFQEESLNGGSVLGRGFSDTEENTCEKFSGVHALTLLFIRKIYFSYGVEIFPHPLVQLIGHIRALLGYIEM